MKVLLRDVAKKYQRDWVFRQVNLDLLPGHSYAVTGPNGSGKSTLIQVIAGNLLPTAGSVTYSGEDGLVEPGEVFRHISFSAPYMDLPSEFTLSEMLRFHFRFKPLRRSLERETLPHFLQLEGAESKTIGNFSTGMKQRLKLGLAVLSDTPVVLLDEPATNLDAEGFGWYRNLVQQYCDNRVFVVCSNRAEEYAFCDRVIDIQQFK